jgi:hypothetical protein
VKRLKLKIIFFTAALCFVTHGGFSQLQPSPSQSPAVDKLDPENVLLVPLGARRQRLAALTLEERQQLFQQFAQLPPSGPSNGKLNALFIAWATVDAVGGLESAEKLSTADARRAAIEALCYGITSEDSPEISKRLKDLTPEMLAPEQKERLLSLGIIKWSQKDPVAAANFLAETYPNAARRVTSPSAGDGDLITAVKGVAENWGKKDPQAALNWFKKSEPENTVGVQSAVLGWWKTDTKAAAAYVRSHTATPNEREVAAAVCGPMTDQDPRVAMQWSEWIKDERLRNQMRVAIATLWAQRAPKDAKAWAEQLSGDEAKRMINPVANAWAASDAKAVEQWIGSLKDFKRDAAIRGYAKALMAKNPEQALDWAQKVREARVRDGLMKLIASEWAKTHPEEAKAWVNKSKLSAAEKKHLLDDTPAAD